MAERPCTILKFLSFVEGNWRNAVFIDACAPSACKAGTPCGGHLLTTDGDGEPILIPAKLFCTLTGELIDPAECSGQLSRFAFEQLYRRKLLWLSPSDRLCGARELASAQPPLPCWERSSGSP